MREIKFRGRGAYAWNDGLLTFWNYGLLTEYKPDCGFAVINNNAVDPATVGQYTGLLDSNGKEIYEGDILLCRHPLSLLPLECCDKSTVYFKDGMFVVEIEKNCIYTVNQILGVRNDGAVIVGNVHDSPELLEADHERD